MPRRITRCEEKIHGLMENTISVKTFWTVITSLSSCFVTVFGLVIWSAISSQDMEIDNLKDKINVVEVQMSRISQKLDLVEKSQDEFAKIAIPLLLEKNKKNVPETP